MLDDGRNGGVKTNSIPVLDPLQAAKIVVIVLGSDVVTLSVAMYIKSAAHLDLNCSSTA